ncbi:MAG: PA14 domain-containing protein [Anaerolineae bacterium]|nr:PA14 domain-containing protein [Anaerolineae bacterium]MDQ7035427.1 PA14 domain-containing protein [Anaerolineae bacterium]
MKRLSKVFGLLLFVLAIGTLMVTPIYAQTTTAQDATWVGVFYSTTTPGQGTSAQATFTGLNRTWAGVPTDANGTALPGIPADSWSARFTTTVTFTSGFWQFQVLADDGVRVTVNNSVVIDAFTSVGTTTQTNTVNLTGGTYNVVVEMVDQSGTAIIQVNWFASTDGGTGGTAAATATPIALTSVSGVLGLAVRSGPFLGASLVAVARPGTDYPVLARNTQEGLFTWYLIQYDADTVGWSSGRYLSFADGSSVAAPLDNETVFDAADDPLGRVIAVTRSVMNFRRYPSQRVGRIPEVPQLVWGAEVQIIARTIQGGRDFWYQVRYTADNGTTYTGWIYAPFVGIVRGSDPIDSVPTK